MWQGSVIYVRVVYCVAGYCALYGRVVAICGRAVYCAVGWYTVC